MERALFRRGRWAGLALVTALLISAQALAATGAEKTPAPQPPVDFLTVESQLSQPQFATKREVYRLPMNGVTIYMEVVRPDAPGRFPVILEASPYHGTLADRDGTRILPGPRSPESGAQIGLTGYFAPRGYAVAMMDLRGTGRSGGCLDHLGPNDAKDLKTTVEWLADQGWSNGRVGMTGHSYVGSTPSVAAAQNPRGLVTIVPSAGLASMYDHQFQMGVPFFLQWAGPQWAYPYLATMRHAPPIGNEPVQGSNTGDDFGNNAQYEGCQFQNSALTSGESQLSGQYVEWHRQRDWSQGAMQWRGPIFLVHGVNDNAARITAAEWFTRRAAYFRSQGLKAPADKAWIGQWNHGSGCCPNRRGIQWTLALHAWFDRWLKKMAVPTGPALEAFLSDGTFAEATTGDRDEILTAPVWPPKAQTVTLYPNAADDSLAAAPGPAGSDAFVADPRGTGLPVGGSLPATIQNSTNGVTYTTAAAATDMVIAGQPRLDLVASTTMPRTHLIANVYDQWTVTSGTTTTTVRRRITQFAINPELRNGIETKSPVTPGQRYTMQPQGFAMAHHLRPGHQLVFRVTASDPDKLATFAIDPEVRVYTGPGGTALHLPVVQNPALYADTMPLDRVVPLAPAQQSIKGSVTPASPGLGARSGPDHAFFEFDILGPEAGVDNARMFVTAIPATPADIDLYLQKRRSDGTWGPDYSGIGGGSAELTRETLNATSRLTPGRWRIEVVNWAGAPATRVDLTIDFFNQQNQKGANAT